MKGVILTGGKGTRLRPFTYVVNKSILPVYDKPLIYFPIMSMINAGIEDIIINAPSPEQIQKVLSDENFKADISYHITKGNGVAAALLDMKRKIKHDPILTIFGDIYLTFGITPPTDQDNCCIYVSTNVPDKLSEYGVAELDSNNKVLSFEEKPKEPKGFHAHMGTTFFPADIIDILESIEDVQGKHFTDVANNYLAQGRLTADIHNKEWFNVGTYENMFLATNYRRKLLN